VKNDINKIIYSGFNQINGGNVNLSNTSTSTGDYVISDGVHTINNCTISIESYDILLNLSQEKMI